MPTEFRPGQQVVVRRDKYERLDTVVSVSPTGQVRLASGSRFTARGLLVGESSHWQAASLHAATPEAVERIEMGGLRVRVQRAVEKVAPDLSRTQCEAILAVIHPPMPAKAE